LKRGDNSAYERWQKPETLEKFKKARDSYNGNNKEELSKKSKARREADPEKYRDRSKKSYKENRAYYIEKSRIRNSVARLSLAELNDTDKRISALCYKASQRISKCLGVTFHVDHIKPLSKGGKHAPENLQIVPAKWNLSKCNRNNDLFPYNTSPTQEFS
jgi:5-methylcytosine-specific restriction endonuclease McrA